MGRHGCLKARFFVASNGVAQVRAPRLTEGERLAVFRRDRFVCRYCGRRVVARHFITDMMRSMGITKANIDHVFPISRGGQNDRSNLVTACGHCNASKGAI